MQDDNGFSEKCATAVPRVDNVVARRVTATVLWSVLFAVAVIAGAAFHLRIPGHSVVFWLPTLFLSRRFCGYRGSSLAVCSGGGLMAMTPLRVFDGRIVGWILGAVAVEITFMLVREGPGFFVGILMGMAANLGKIVPKVVTIAAVGATPNHNRQTLPFMVVSYLICGAIAGLISVATWKGTRRLRK